MSYCRFCRALAHLKVLSISDRDLIHSVDLSPVPPGENVRDCLFAAPHAKPLLKRGLLYKEIFFSLGANSFHLEQTSFQKRKIVFPGRVSILLNP